MAFHGKVNCINVFNSGSNQSVQYAFATLHTALSSSQAESVGIFCRAKSFAANLSGTWEKTNAIPTHAWSVFEFTSANPKFWIIIQASGDAGGSDGISFGSINGGIVDDPDQTQRTTLGISFAVCDDGSSPWTGTTNGSNDSKGSPMWNSGSNSIRLATFPLINESRGANSVNRNAFHATYWPGYSPYPPGDRHLHHTYHHYVYSEDSLTILHGLNHGLFYSWTYVGKYNPIDPSNDGPYCFVALNKTSLEDNTSTSESFHGNDPVKFGNNLFGGSALSTLESNVNAKYFGGVIDPVKWGATRAAIIRPEFSTNRRIMYSAFNNTLRRDMDAYNLGLYLDSYSSRGYVGEIENIKIVHSLPHGATLHNRQWVVVGQWSRASKLAFRWGALIAPGGAVTREGYVF